MAIDAVVADVELATDEPLGERQVPLEGGLEGLRPADRLGGDPRPERLDVAIGLLVEGRLGIRLRRKGRIRRESLTLTVEGFDLGALIRALLDAHAGNLLVISRAAILRGPRDEAEKLASRGVGPPLLPAGELLVRRAIRRQDCRSALAGEDHPMGPRDLDPVRRERGEQPLAE